MKKISKVLLLLLVLAPSIFFLSRAFAGNEAQLVEDKLVLTGPGSFELQKNSIEAFAWEEQLPELNGTGGFSLGWIKKGNFIRKSDGESIRLVKNRAEGFIYLRTEGMDYYFNLSGALQTEAFFEKLKAWKKETD